MAKEHAGKRRLADIDWERWRAVDRATLTFVVHEEQVLLIRKKRGLGAGKINGPGGKVDPGETPHECAIRECQEEIGVTPLDLRFAGENLFQFVDGYSIHVWTYVARAHEGEPIETDEATPLWFPISGIPYGEMWSDDEHWLPHVLDGRRIHGRWIFDGDDFLDYDLKVEPSASIQGA